jgi:hypothetical protein
MGRYAQQAKRGRDVTDGFGPALPPVSGSFDVTYASGTWNCHWLNGAPTFPKFSAFFRRPEVSNVWTRCTTGPNNTTVGVTQLNPYGFHAGTHLQVRAVYCNSAGEYTSVPSEWIDIVES